MEKGSFSCFIESFEIFKKYNDDCPYAVGVGHSDGSPLIFVHVYEMYIDTSDLDRLIELGWVMNDKDGTLDYCL